MEPSASETDKSCFAGTSREPVPDGGILTIVFEDRDRAGQTVTVTATDRDDETACQQLAVELRGNGKGTAQLVVPAGWSGIVLACEGSRPLTVDVAVPP